MICIYDLRLLVWGLGLYRDQGIEVGDLLIYLFFGSLDLSLVSISQKRILCQEVFSLYVWPSVPHHLGIYSWRSDHPRFSYTNQRQEDRLLRI